MTKSFWIALVIVAVLGVTAVVLVTGGPGAAERDDTREDVAITDGEGAPRDTSLADIESAEVTVTEQEIVFRATLGAEIPKEVPDGSLELTWDVLEDGDATWIVQVNVNVGLSATIAAHRTGYRAGTVDGTLPGEVQVNGQQVTVTIERGGRVRDIPSGFQWRLTSTLDGALGDNDSAVATDRFPDSGARDAASG